MPEARAVWWGDSLAGMSYTISICYISYNFAERLRDSETAHFLGGTVPQKMGLHRLIVRNHNYVKRMRETDLLMSAL